MESKRTSITYYCLDIYKWKKRQYDLKHAQGKHIKWSLDAHAESVPYRVFALFPPLFVGVFRSLLVNIEEEEEEKTQQTFA